MRILLAWFSQSPETKNLIFALKEAGHEVIYWVGGGDDRKIEIPGTIVHTHYAARNGIPAPGVDISKFYPPGEILIKQLYETESVVLTMMNKRFDWMCVDERKHIYYNTLQYWNGVMNKYRPDIVVFSAIPHAPFSYIIYGLSRLLNIKIIIFDNVSRVGVPDSDLKVGFSDTDRMLMYVDSWESSRPLLEALEKNQDKNFSSEDLSEDLRKYYELHTVNHGGDPTPSCIKEDKDLYSGFRLATLKARIILRSIKDFTIFEKVLTYVQKLFRQNIKQEYVSLQSEPDFAKKFVYVPLHYQPECSTSPLGGVFVDQILMIEILSASIPDDWVIYIKEHPVQWLIRGLNFISSRYRGYYKRMAKLKNVKLVPVEADNYDLIRNSQVVATVVGSAGFEAVLRSKPAIVFGYPWYQYCHAVFKVAEVKLCQEVLQKIKNGFKVDQQKVINHLKAFNDVSFHGFTGISKEMGKKLKKSGRDGMRNIIQALLLEFKKY
ncbi:MAG: hypothetical protein AAB890_02605 [Patescibacteria group bacterium]